MNDRFKRYKNFLLETQVAAKDKRSKPPELNIIYSVGFRSALIAIQNMKQSNISKRLLELESSKDKFFDFSYVDITKDVDTITYLPANRVERFKSEGKPNEEFWTSKSRVSQKVGRFIKQVLPSFSEKSIVKFVDKFKTIIQEETNANNFELVEGDEIVFWYNSKNYETIKGTLGSSCMSDDECGPYLNIYKNNPNQCKLLILKNEAGDKIKGRALVWKLSDDRIFMDRVYTSNDSDIMTFTNYAKKQGWLCKDKQNYGLNDLNIIEKGKFINPNMEVHIDNTNFEEYPYVDTLRYYYPKIKTLSSVRRKTSPEDGELMTLTDTEGKYAEYQWPDDEYDDPLVHDGYNNIEINESEAQWCVADDGYCHRDDVVELTYNHTFAFPNSPNVVYSEYSKKPYIKKDATFSNLLNTWIWTKYAVDVYHDRNRTGKPDVTHRFESGKSIGKVGDYYYDLNLLKVTGTKQVEGTGKDKGKFKIEYTYEFK
jgi:hypothetical protein